MAKRESGVKNTIFVLVTAFAAVLIVVGVMSFTPQTVTTGRVISPSGMQNKLMLTVIFSLFLSFFVIFLWKRSVLKVS